jgi:hypothetical protein
MSNLDEDERLHLDKMISNFDCDDNTPKIRTLKHSSKIRDNVEIFLNLKRKYPRLVKHDKKKFNNLIMSHCSFLWENYTNIFNKLLKDELDINILYAFIEKLKEIEDGIIDQHEASVDIGRILKRLYIDSALRGEKNFEEKDNSEKRKELKPVSNISWAKYKTTHML